MKVSMNEALGRLPAAPTAAYPEGAPFMTLLAGGSMSVEVFAPGSNADGRDLQTPHSQDELYFVQRGLGDIVIADQRFAAAAGDAFLSLQAWRTASRISRPTSQPGWFFMARRAANRLA